MTTTTPETTVLATVDPVAAELAIATTAADAAKADLEGFKTQLETEPADEKAAISLTETLALLKDAKDKLVDRRTEITSPLRKRTKAIEQTFKPILDAFEAAIHRGGESWLAWKRKRDQEERERRLEAQRRADEAAAAERRAREERERAAAAAAVGAPPPAPLPAPPPPAPVVLAPAPLFSAGRGGIRTDVGTVGVKKTWDVEVDSLEEIARKRPALLTLRKGDALDLRGSLVGAWTEEEGLRGIVVDGLRFILREGADVRVNR